MDGIDLSPALIIKYSNDREPRRFCFTYQVIHGKKNFTRKKILT